MAIIVEAGTSNAELLLSVSGPGSRAVESLDDLKRVLVDSPHESAVVIGAGVDLNAASAFSDTLRVTRPSLSVILVRRRVDTSVLAEALRSGMREVVEERDLTGLGEAVKRARELYVAVTGPTRPDAGRTDGSLISVFSPKGGVGKTTLSANLTVALAARGHRVCLVDLDLSFGDVALTLQLAPVRTIGDVVALDGDIDADTLEPLLTEHKRGFSALLAPVQPDAEHTISVALVAKALAVLKGEFDYVVVDTAPAFNEHVLQAIDASDHLLMVTTLDVPTLKNVKIANETLDLLSFPRSRRHLVLNRADDKVGLTSEKVETTLGMPVAQAVPTSIDIAHATNTGEPITASHPRHAASQAYGKLADRLVAASAVHTSTTGATGGSKRQTMVAEAPRKRLLRRGSKA
jgi:pilus assembly protein CpaE